MDLPYRITVAGLPDCRGDLMDAIDPALNVPYLFDALHAEVLALRIEVAQQRDSIPNEAEMLAMLEVYSEFGR